MLSRVSKASIAMELTRKPCMHSSSIKSQRDRYNFYRRKHEKHSYLLNAAWPCRAMPRFPLYNDLSPLPLMIPRPLSRRLHHWPRILNRHRLPGPNAHFLHCLPKQPTLGPASRALQIPQCLTCLAHALLHLHQLPLMLLLPLIPKQLPCPMNRPMSHVSITRHP